MTSHYRKYLQREQGRLGTLIASERDRHQPDERAVARLEKVEAVLREQLANIE